MNTGREHRLLVVAPLVPLGAYTFAAFRTWWVNNAVPADPGGEDDPAGWPALNVLGDLAPATHRWWCGALRDVNARAILYRACVTAAVTTPTVAQWDGWTGAQKRAWWQSVRAGVRTATGLFLTAVPQDSDWGNPADVLNLLGVKVSLSAGQ